MGSVKLKFTVVRAEKLVCSLHSQDCEASGWQMNLTGVKIVGLIVLSGSILAGCGGGGSSASATTPLPTPSPTASPTPVINGTPGPVIASWKGNGTFTTQSDPAWPLTFSGVEIGATVTNGPPINFTALHQSVTVTISQANYAGILPTLLSLNGNCTQFSAVSTGQTQMRISYDSIGSTGCKAQFYGSLDVHYPGYAALVPITVPSGG